MNPKRNKTEPDEDGQTLHTIVSALITGHGRGGLSWMARKLGTTPSNLRKRLASAAGAFDPMTLRAALLVLAQRADKFDTEALNTTDVGELVVEMRETEEGPAPTWRPKA